MRASMLLLSMLLLTPSMCVPVLAQDDPLTAELNHEIALARREGFGKPDAGASSRSPASPDNAAPLYQEIAHTLGPQPGLSWYWPLSCLAQHGPLSLEQVAQAKSVLTTHSDALDLAHRAARRLYCFVEADPDPTQGGYVSLLPAMRAAARILCAESAVQLAGGRAADAVHPLIDCCRIAKQTFASDRLSDTMVGEEIEEMALGALQRILYAAGSDARACSAVASACDAVGTPDMIAMLHREMIFAVSANNWSAAHPHDTHEGAPGPARPDLAALAHERREGLLHVVRALRMLQPLVQLPYHVALPKLTAIIRQLNPGEDADNPYDGYALDMHRTALTAYAHLMAYRSVIVAAAAALALRASSGSFPVTLSQATAHPPIDPFTGGPIGYRREPSGFVVFSKGASGRYDGSPLTARRARNEQFVRYPWQQPTQQ